LRNIFRNKLKILFKPRKVFVKAVVSFDEQVFCTEGERTMIMKLENYKWAKANAFIHVCNLNLGKKARVVVMHTNGLTR